MISLSFRGGINTRVLRLTIWNCDQPAGSELAMETYFRELSDTLCAGLADGEVLLLNYQGETSDFARLNHNRIRQAGHVHHQALELDLVRDGRESGASMPLCGSLDADLAQARTLLDRLRTQLPLLPGDPHLNYATEVHDSIHCGEDRLPEPGAALETLMEAARGLDLVGIWAGGEQSRGFANSLGQRNWHAVDSFNFDWSLHGEGGRAVKSGSAGFAWDPAVFPARLEAAAGELALLENGDEKALVLQNLTDALDALETSGSVPASKSAQ